jgi:hypothetical protein
MSAVITTLRIVSMICVALTATAVSVSAQSLPAPPVAVVTDAANAPAAPSFTHNARKERLGRWLQYLEQRGHGQRVGNAIWQFVDAGVLITWGVSLALRRPDQGTNNWPWIATTAISLGLGAANILGAVNSLTLESIAEDRYAHWSALTEIDDVTIGRFEGELAAQAATGRRLRISTGFSSIALAMGGAAVLVLTPTVELTTHGRIGSYAAGGAILAYGIWDAIMKLTGESHDERMWRSYEAGANPEQASAQLHVTPLFAANGGGMALSGQF